MNNYYLIHFPQHGDDRGMMCVAECGANIPFSIERIFYDYKNTIDGVGRGNHANRYSKFVFICLNGVCSINVDDGQSKQSFTLDNPTEGLFVDSMVWKEIYFHTSNSILLVLSNLKYNPDEYIRDYDIFVKEVRKV